MTKQTSHFKGILSLDAPGLYQDFTRMFLLSELDTLSFLFSETANRGGLLESRVKRPAGANYNPKPARICHILLKEFQEKNKHVFGAGMLSCLSDPELYVTISGFEEEKQLASLVLFSLKNGLEHNSNLLVERITLAQTLDNLRHLHMTSLSEEEKQDQISHLKDKIISKMHYQDNIRLQLLIERIIERRYS